MNNYRFTTKYVYSNRANMVSGVANITYGAVNPFHMTGVNSTDYEKPTNFDQPFENVSSVRAVEATIAGFRYLDDSMKAYWSDIRIQNKELTRFARVRVAGGSKSIMIWADDLKNGRVSLPVISLSRTGHRFFDEYYTPPYLPMRKVYTDRSKSRMRMLYKPIPYVVSYTMNIWTEHKHDADAITSQILTRVSPVAQYYADDGQLVGPVIIKYGGLSDQTDKEVGADQHAKVKYEVTLEVEAWLSLPTVETPTILGTTMNTRLIAPLTMASSIKDILEH